MGKVIIPKTYVQNIEEPLFFLAGPVRGAPNWQDEAIEFILSQKPDSVLVSPRRGIRDTIAPYIVSGDGPDFPRQRAMERHYLDIASKKGVILFWLPGEVIHKCKKAYGAMTRVEIGQWMTRYSFDKNVRFCVGSDGKFSELHTIRYDLQLDAPDKEIFTSLEDTCREALRLAYQN